ncbi:MAG: ABC transporter permease [Actinomycetes bacterium]
MALTVSAPSPGDVAADIPEEVAGRSLWQITWNRIRHDRTAMVCLVVVLMYYAVALLAGPIMVRLGIDPYSFDGAAVSDNAGAPYGAWGGISREHLLGVEWGTGRDILAQLLNGLRISLFIATVSTIAVVVLGIVFGIISGYSRGVVDTMIGWLIDIILAFPFILLVLALSGVMTQRLEAMGVPEGNPARITCLIVLFSVFGWTYLARLIRGQILSLREKEFIESAVSMGSGTTRILFKELLPNLWPTIIVYTTITLPVYISTEAAFAYLGVGTLPPDVTFGAMLGNSVGYFRAVPSYLFIPGTLLVVLVVAFSLLGDAVRDALDPRAGRV